MELTHNQGWWCYKDLLEACTQEDQGYDPYNHEGSEFLYSEYDRQRERKSCQK